MTATQFDIVTPDRRITGATPTTNGAYFRYFAPGASTEWPGCDARRRLLVELPVVPPVELPGGTGHVDHGFMALASADENRLYKAEALLRLGRTAEAVTEINFTRTRGVKLGTTTTDQQLAAGD